MSVRTFADASREIQASLQKHMEMNSVDLTDSDESEDDKENGVICHTEILDRVFGFYELNREVVGNRTKDALFESLKIGNLSSSCLICISSIKRSDSIWSCKSCYCSFHLSCIQRWAKDNVYQQKAAFHEQINQDARGHIEASFKWGCPKCRHTYSDSEIPLTYMCYCGKEANPQLDPWNVPHSCGTQCSKPLQPECGHKCLVLCHPGPCPPCPKMVYYDCFCKQTNAAPRRCYEKGWACHKPCNKVLGCGHHKCSIVCHPGPCPPCKQTSYQTCLCKRKRKMLRCEEPTWQCTDKCNQPLKCKHHFCDLPCHSGICPPCPLSLVRRCPCGRTQHKLQCIEATPTCVDTCGKVLECGKHTCPNRCHRGECSPCQESVKKSCRCGLKQRQVFCSKSYLCEVKCKNYRDCKRHHCQRKCCDGESCPSCDLKCNRSLACKNHKCNSRCHIGGCAPCTSTQEVSCSCGASRRLVPCGMERVVQPPRCKLRCKKPPDCHHPERTSHICHKGDCPPCEQICETTMKCGHLCPQPCHDRVKMVVREAKKGATPCEEVKEITEIRAKPCPDCLYPVPVTCLGSHETSEWPCHLAIPQSCGRKCGRVLSCKNHACEKECHTVDKPPNATDAGSNCCPCESECLRDRMPGCTHPCKKPCHPEPCDPCAVLIRIRCHCTMSQLYVKCGDWTSAENATKELLGCCKDQCPKLMSCSHRCFRTCHSGKCGSEKDCKKKVKMFCPCKRLKVDLACSMSKTMKVDCDSSCEEAKILALKALELEADRQREEEERQRRLEAERFERKHEGRRRRRNRRDQSENVEETFFERYKYRVVLSLLSVLVAVGSGVWYTHIEDVDGLIDKSILQSLNETLSQNFTEFNLNDTQGAFNDTFSTLSNITVLLSGSFANLNGTVVNLNATYVPLEGAFSAESDSPPTFELIKSGFVDFEYFAGLEELLANDNATSSNGPDGVGEYGSFVDSGVVLSDDFTGGSVVKGTAEQPLDLDLALEN